MYHALLPSPMEDLTGIVLGSCWELLPHPLPEKLEPLSGRCWGVSPVPGRELFPSSFHIKGSCTGKARRVFAHIKYAGIREVILATKRQYGLNGTPQRAVYNNLIRKFNALKGTETSRMQDFGNMRAAVVSTMQGFDAAVAGLFF